jgi:putative oxidoreductase
MSANLNATSPYSPTYSPTYQSTVLLVSRLFMAGVFLVFGIRKLMAVTGTAGYFTKLGLPMPEILVWLVILVEVGGAILLIVGWRTRLVAWILAGFVVLATIAAHRYWEMEAAQYVPQLTNFMKNLAIVGGLLCLTAMGPGRYSVDRN